MWMCGEGIRCSIAASAEAGERDGKRTWVAAWCTAAPSVSRLPQSKTAAIACFSRRRRCVPSAHRAQSCHCSQQNHRVSHMSCRRHPACGNRMWVAAWCTAALSVSRLPQSNIAAIACFSCSRRCMTSTNRAVLSLEQGMNTCSWCVSRRLSDAASPFRMGMCGRSTPCAICARGAME